MQYRKLVKGAIRLPIIFFGLNIMLKCKKQTNITFFVKLSILNYRCPGVTYITNFTRMPLLRGNLITDDHHRQKIILGEGQSKCSIFLYLRNLCK